MSQRLQLKDYDGNPVGEVYMGYVAKSMTLENFTELMDDFCNSYCRDFEAGVEVGKMLHTHHRTLQATIYRFILGMIVGLSQQEHWDARNKIAVENAKKIAEMLDSGEIQRGYMI